MFWQELTSDAFPRAIEQAEGVCLVPISAIERHGHHLPLATDLFIGREVCRRAAALEPAVIFPDIPFGQIQEARHEPGAIAFSHEASWLILKETCREIARNGFTKVVLVNSHGGNSYLLALFAQEHLAGPQPYTLYVADPILLPLPTPEVDAQWETQVDGHAGESETSQILAIRPDLVHLADCPAGDEGMPQGRLQALRDAGIYTGMWWYGDYPTHYCGDGRPATPAKGDFELQYSAQRLARAVRLIKDDTETLRLAAEFQAKAAGR